MTQTESFDVTVILSTGHREMLELLAEIHGTVDAGQRRELADAVIA